VAVSAQSTQFLEDRFEIHKALLPVRDSRFFPPPSRGEGWVGVRTIRNLVFSF
jgi:hypothetical protein